MNQRIKQLAEQAGMTDDKFGMFFAKDFDSHCADGVDLEKFAELIVRECIREIGYKSVELLDIDFYPHYQERLKKHFGVEE